MLSTHLSAYGDPSAPIPLSPTGATIIATHRPTFTWFSDASTSGYRIRILTNGAVFADSEYWYEPDATNYTWSYPSLPDGDYTWTMLVYDDSWMDSPWSETNAFSVDGPDGPVPEPPTPLDPKNITVRTGRVSFVWTAVANATGYRFEYEGDRQSGASWADYFLWTNTWVDDLPAGEYTWTVMGRNDNGDGEWSSNTQFTVVVPSPEHIVATAVRAQSDVEIEWDVIAKEKYRLQSCTNLAVTFIPVGNILTALTSRLETKHSDSTGLRRFYRLRLVEESGYHIAKP